MKLTDTKTFYKMIEDGSGITIRTTIIAVSVKKTNDQDVVMIMGDNYKVYSCFMSTFEEFNIPIESIKEGVEYDISYLENPSYNGKTYRNIIGFKLAHHQNFEGFGEIREIVSLYKITKDYKRQLSFYNEHPVKDIDLLRSLALRYVALAVGGFTAEEYAKQKNA